VVDWKKIKAEYVAGGVSYRELCEKHGVSESSMRKRAAKEQWTELRNSVDTKNEQLLVDKIAEETVSIDEKYYKLVDKLMSKAEQVIEDMPVWQPSNLKEMATALKYLKECKGVKSDLDIKEQKARIAKLEKEAAEQTNETQSVIVRLEGDVEKWSK
jgi:transposase-like protein